jgi:hypothetical protein
MKWVVVEENPKPDNYIVVILTDTTRKLHLQARAHTVYDDGDRALARARQLRDQFGVRIIRIFQNDGPTMVE